MSTLIFDIETVGEDYTALMPTTQEMLTRWIKQESHDEEDYKHALTNVKESLGFRPAHGADRGAWRA